MATIALGIIGGYVGGPVGAKVGVALGSYIDANFTLKALFGGNSPEPSKVNDFGLSGLSAGEPIAIALGEACRFPVQYIWTSEVRELQGGTGGGGKHSGGQQAYVWNYKADVGLACGVGPYSGLAAESPDLHKVFADNQVIYDTSEPPVYRSNGFELEATTRTIYDPETNAIEGYDYMMTIHEGSSGMDLTFFRVGSEISLVWFGPTHNNGKFTITSSGKLHPITGKSWMKINDGVFPYTSTAAYGGSAVLGSPFDLAAMSYWTVETFSRDALTSLKFYPGEGLTSADTRQPVDPLVFSEANETPAAGHSFGGIAWFLIRDLNLNPYGNRFPMFEVLGTEAYRSYPSTIARLMELAGFEASQYDLSGIRPYMMRGYVVRGPVTLREAIQPLGVAQELLSQEDGDTIKLFSRDNAQLVVIDDEDLGTAAIGEHQAFPVKFSNISQQSIPTEIVVNFNNLEMNCQPDSVSARVHETRNTKTVKIQLPISMTKLEAQRIADKTLWVGRSASKLATIQLPFKYVRIGENTRIKFNAYNQEWYALVQKVDRSASTGAIELEAMVENFSTLPLNETNMPGQPIRYTPVDPTISSLPLMMGQTDMPGLFEEHLDQLGVYLPVAPLHDETNWTGGLLYVSDAGAEDYRSLKTLPSAAKMGYTTDALPAGDVGVWDLTSTVNVRLVAGKLLESRTEDEVLGGANHGVVGVELIAWQDAVLEADGSWTLSKLLRGLRNSADAVGVHDVGDFFYQIERSTCNFVPIAAMSMVGRTFDFKAASTGQFLENVTKRPVKVRGLSMKPFTPIELTAVASPGGWTISWEPVTRSFYDPLSSSRWSSLEDINKFQIEVYSDGGSPLTDTPLAVFEVEDNQFSTNLGITEVTAEVTIDLDVEDFVLAVRQVGTSGLSKPAYITITAGSYGAPGPVSSDAVPDETLTLMI